MSVSDARRPELNLSGTFAGNTVSMAAGIASVRELTAERIETMAERTRVIEVALRQAAGEHGLPFSSRSAGSLLSVYFSETPPPFNALRDDSEVARVFHLAALTRGVFIAPRALINTSSVLSESDAQEAAEKLQAAVADVCKERAAAEVKRR